MSTIISYIIQFRYMYQAIKTNTYILFFFSFHSYQYFAKKKTEWQPYFPGNGRQDDL